MKQNFLGIFNLPRVWNKLVFKEVRIKKTDFRLKNDPSILEN